MSRPVSRRLFTHALGAGLGGALVARSRRASAAPGLRPASRAEAIARQVRISSNENPFGPSPAALDALTRAQARAARYPFSWIGELRQALADHHGLQPENVLLSCGSTEVLRVAVDAFTDSRRALVAAATTFEAVLDYARVEASRSVKLPLTADHRHDLDAMAAACDADTGLVYVCNPNNPTASIVSGSALRRFLGQLPKGPVVLVDEAYCDYVEDPAYARVDGWLADHPDLLSVRTFSKIHGLAGMRLGYALGSAERIASMQEHLLDNSTNVAVVEAALASLGDPAYLERVRRHNNDTRRLVLDELVRQGREVIPSHASFFMLRVGPVEPVISGFAARGILVGRKFPSMPDWLRVSIGTVDEMDAFLEALPQIVPA